MKLTTTSLSLLLALGSGLPLALTAKNFMAPSFSMAATADDDTSADKYAVSFDRDLDRTRSDRYLNSVTLGSQTLTNPLTGKMYQDLTAYAFSAKAGETVAPTFGYSGSWMHGYVYIDQEGDGTYSAAVNSDGTLADGTDLMTYSFYSQSESDDSKGYNSKGTSLTGSARNVLNPPSFTIPALADGFYMMRYKVDWNSIDPAGATVSSNSIINNGGDILDVRLRIFSNDAATIKATAAHGQLLTTDGADLDGAAITIGQPVKFTAPSEDGYSLYGLYVLHGVLTGDSIVDGVAQRALSKVALQADENGVYTIPAILVDGDLAVTAIYQHMVFHDEFNQPGNNVPDPTKWASSTKATSTWNRFIADSRDVAFVQDSILVLRCIPNPDKTGDSDAMLSGALETKNIFSFTYGRAEARLKTGLYTGNFPAFWMMPQPPCDGWPTGGEIDIFESIDAQKRAYHTIHSHWSYDLGNKSNPTSSANETLDVSQWHVYAVEWDSTQIRWYVDGSQVFSYSKSTDSNALSNGQWPFTHPFYVIVNQSVGNGSWAAKADTSHTYETQVDWVRVYQTEETTVGISQVQDFTQKPSTQYAVYDLQGRRVAKPAKGIYIQNGKKVWIR